MVEYCLKLSKNRPASGIKIEKGDMHALKDDIIRFVRKPEAIKDWSREYFNDLMAKLIIDH